MLIGKLKHSDDSHRVGVVDGDKVWIGSPNTMLSDVLFAESPNVAAEQFKRTARESMIAADALWAAPIDDQEVWAAGVTYVRSKQARMDESPTSASVYDRVYSAERPELFFKATASRVVGPNEPVRVRFDSKWSVPEPEVALVISPAMKIVGFTIGNDMSARDIEGENPLYLPQAKVYRGCCALGPVIRLGEKLAAADGIEISLMIERGGNPAFNGSTTFASMKRSPEELVRWLVRENEFPNGAFLLTGTGIVPPDDFSLEDGDVVHIDVIGVGRLTNPVVKSRS
jgi:2-dehydro-3-deoxy-D-arabinonate dehydratase